MSGDADDAPPPVPRIALTPRPTDPGPSAPSPTVGPGTRERLVLAEQRRAAFAGDGTARHLRTTVAFGLAAAALAAAWRLLGPRDE